MKRPTARAPRLSDETPIGATIGSDPTFRCPNDDEVVGILREHPGTSSSAIARALHQPGQAVDWHALKRQVSRLHREGRIERVVNGRRRRWFGWRLAEGIGLADSVSTTRSPIEPPG